MNITNQELSQFELMTLVKYVGSEIVAVSGETMFSPDFAASLVTVHTSNGPLDLELSLQPFDVVGETLDYSTLSIRDSSKTIKSDEKHGNIYFQDRGKKIHEIWLIRDSVTATRNQNSDFTYIADVGIVFKTDNMWLAFSRASHIMETFCISRSETRDGLGLRNMEREWEVDLLDSYEFSREWIKVESK